MSVIPQKFCLTGKHLYAAAFNECPEHSKALTRYNVRIRTKYYTIVKPDGSKTNDWTFQQLAETPALAARAVIDALFGSKEVAQFHCRGIEVWKGDRVGVPKREIWRGG